MNIIFTSKNRIGVLIIGDSLAVPIPNIHYGYLLQNELLKKYSKVDLENHAKFANTIIGVHEKFPEQLENFPPDIVILQIGIVDSWSRLELNGNPKVDHKTFAEYYDKIIKIMKVRKQIKLIIIGICPTSRRMDTKYSGTLQRIGEYNQILMAGSDQHQIFYIDMQKYIDIENPSVYLMPDDHHLNPKGNELIFKLIKFELEKMGVLDSN